MILKLRESFISLETKLPQARHYDTVVIDETDIQPLMEEKLKEFEKTQKGFYHVVDAFAPEISENGEQGKSFRVGRSKEEYLITDAIIYEQSKFAEYS